MATTLRGGAAVASGRAVEVGTGAVAGNVDGAAGCVVNGVGSVEGDMD